jgi:hypothetical protein
MSNINKLLSKFRASLEMNDGTLKDGYLSVTGGRYRIIINETGNNNDGMNNDDPVNLPTLWDNMTCGGTNGGCTNYSCDGTTNTRTLTTFQDCVNGYCGGLGTSSNQTSSAY